jgi:serine/threonine-protein kinase
LPAWRGINDRAGLNKSLVRLNLETAPSNLMNPQRLGPYELMSVLGRGGMGTVYAARDSHSGETVAVKSLAPTLSFDEHFRHRFESEIETMTKMDHPNIVRILGYGQDEGILFFAMELVEGKSLFALQKEGILFDWRQVIQISIDVCSGLQHAHNRGIIHRDLKPGNLIRENSGNVKITDFGIAKTYGGSALTGEGSILGTMDYMAPEQARGGKVTPRSDLYSLGAVMYALLSRRPPLKADTLEESLRNLTSVRPVSIRKLVPTVPRELAAVIHRLLEKDPKKRFGTSVALSKFLADLQTHLRDSAEAKTKTSDQEDATRAITGDGVEAGDDFIVTRGSTGTPQTGKAPAAGTRAKSSLKAATKGSTVPLAASPPGGLVHQAPEDFFSTISRQSPQKTEEPKGPGLRGVIPLALALVAVLTVLGFGVQYALRRPTADELLAQIEPDAETPTRAQESIDLFLRYYPEHDRAAEIRQLASIADAIRLRNSLVRRQRNLGPSTLNAMETEFLELTDFDTPGDYRKLQAMITLYEASDSLDPAAQKILAAARTYKTKFRLDAEHQASKGRERIQNALDSCAEADPETARGICESIIELYAGQNWALDLVAQAREKLEQLPPL